MLTVPILPSRQPDRAIALHALLERFTMRPLSAETVEHLFKTALSALEVLAGNVESGGAQPAHVADELFKRAKALRDAKPKGQGDPKDED